MSEEERQKKIQEIEQAMYAPDFWSDKIKAQALVKELQELKDFVPGAGKYDKGDAVMTIFAGAGGDDAEDFVGMLFQMYQKYIARQGWDITLLSQNENDHGGYRNITIEIKGKSSYGRLKRESGVSGQALLRLEIENTESIFQSNVKEVYVQF